MGDTLPIFERLTLNRNFKVMKLLNSFLLASATAGTCEKSGNYGCTGGTKSDRHFLRWITGQTADTCKSECLKDEECQDFVLVWSGTCYLYSGECDRRPQSNAEYYKCSKGDPDPCDAKGCDDGCTNTDGIAVCDCCTNPTQAGEDPVCSCTDPLIFDDTNTRCVQQCTVKNGGCDASAVCTNPTQAGEDPVCSCATGEQFASDGRTCTSTADAAKYCPTSTCWTYETVEGEKKCVMKTGTAATDAGCIMYLYCSPSTMDFRWNEAKLLGVNTNLNNADTNCAIEASSGDVGDTTPTGVDKMWQHPPASCDSTVTREDVDGEDMIIITKSFEFQGDTTGKNVGPMIYLDDAATVTIDVCCKFKATQSATSDDISNEVEGKLDAVGSWDGSLKIEFTDNAYAIKKTDAAILGDMHYVKVSWTVGSSPLAEKVNWYVDDCTVIDATDANKKVDIIENQCFASVINAINESTNMLSTSDFKFEFKSFSFNAAGNGSQKLSCNINFCLKETECAAETAKTGLTCDYAQALKWVKPN